jgi:hypothetical protein
VGRSVLALFDNGWLYFFALDNEGRMAMRYEGDRRRTVMPCTNAAAPLSSFEAAL